MQRLVDRRFNRARYDRDALVAAFGAKLRDAVDSETVLAELAGAAANAVEPVHVSVWVARSSPLDELPDLRLGRGVLADLGERRDRRLEPRHRLVAPAERVEDVGGVVLERRLAVPVADRDAERERLLGQREGAVELAFRAEREREVVERRGARDGIVVVRRESEAPLELGSRLGVVASAGREDAEDVVRLRERARVGGLLGERERLLGERLRLVVAAPAVRVEAAVGDDARRERRGRVAAERVLERALGELPLAAALVEEADPVLDRAELLRGRRARRRPRSCRAPRRTRRRASRDPRSPRGARPDRRPRARAPRGTPRAPRRSRRESRACSPARRYAAAASASRPASRRCCAIAPVSRGVERVGRATVQEPPPPGARQLVRDASRLLVAERELAAVALGEESAPRELLERRRPSPRRCVRSRRGSGRRRTVARGPPPPRSPARRPRSTPLTRASSRPRTPGGSARSSAWASRYSTTKNGSPASPRRGARRARSRRRPRRRARRRRPGRVVSE